MTNRTDNSPKRTIRSAQKKTCRARSQRPLCGLLLFRSSKNIISNIALNRIHARGIKVKWSLPMARAHHQAQCKRFAPTSCAWKLPCPPPWLPPFRGKTCDTCGKTWPKLVRKRPGDLQSWEGTARKCLPRMERRPGRRIFRVTAGQFSPIVALIFGVTMGPIVGEKRHKGLTRAGKSLRAKADEKKGEKATGLATAL